jgi:hypothetical protein
MHLVYLSTDELNRSLVRDWGGKRGIAVECPGRADGVLDGPCDALLLDLDHATSEWIGTLATWLESDGGVCPVAVHGYGTTADAFRAAFRGRGVTVRSRLRPRLLRDLALDARLRDLARAAPVGPGPDRRRDPSHPDAGGIEQDG